MDYPWIVEAKKHIGLKEVPGPKSNPTIVGWLKSLKAWYLEDQSPWCFTGDTELFTEDGWIRLDEIKEDQKVYQVNANGELSITPIIRKIEKEYNDDVFVINHRNLKLTCDIGHRWWGNFHEYKENLRFGTLDELNIDGLSIPAAYSGKEDCGLSVDQLWLLAAFISDGKLRYSESIKNKEIKVPIRIEFEVSRQRKIQALNALKPDHVYIQKKAYGPLTKTPLSVFSFKYPEYFNFCLNGYKALSREFINSLSVKDARVFLQAYTMFDGNGDIDDNAIIYTSDKQMLDDLLAIITLAGLHASIRINKYGSNLTKKTAYRLVWCYHKENRHIKQQHVERKAYSGKLFCVQVPEGRIVVKSPGYSPIVTGNCGLLVANCMQVNGISIPKYWMRALAWSEWGVKLDKPIDGCVVVFKRTGGGHVGFVMGETKDGYLSVLGGNQGDAVSIAKFDKSRVVGYYWPKEFPVPANQGLSIVSASGSVSTNEA